jgi:hypothetical protein
VSELTLRFTRLSPTHHRFEYRRPDGSGEALELETSGVLAHDLLHYALESEARLKGSFYGILARIGGYEELSVGGGAALGGEVAITERVVGALAAALRDGDLESEAFVERVTDYLALDDDERAPRWLKPPLVLAVREQLRALTQRWNATAVGEAMELAFRT